MAKLGINTGSTPNDGTGDSLLSGGIKINSNFDEVYSAIGDGTNISIPVTSIVAGTNVSVSSSTGNVTINATGGGGGSGITTENIIADTLVVSGVSTLANATFSGISTASAGFDFKSTADVRIGPSNQISISHNTSNGNLTCDTGYMYIRGASGFRVQKEGSGVDDIIIANSDGDVQLFHNDVLKLSTASIGATVAGSLLVGAGQSFGSIDGAAAVYYGDGSNLSGISTFSGNYNDLTNTPTIPTNNNQLTNGAGFITTSFTNTSQLNNDAGFITSVGVRTEVSGTTGSIGAGSSATVDITGFKSYSLFKITTNHPAWVSLFVDSTSRTSDAGRSYLTDPSPGSGLIAEVRTTTAGTSTFLITPGVIGWNNDTSTSNKIYARVTNNDSVSRAITVDLTVVKLED